LRSERFAFFMATFPASKTQRNLYKDYVNPQWVKLLDVLGMNVQYVRCTGSELFTADGRRILDFISGYCVHNIGHNHPAVIDAIKREMDCNGPAMLQSHVADLAGELAQRLCERAGGKLTRAFFGSSGSEGIDTVIKFARARTGRAGILYAQGGFHGLTCGPLSLMSNPFWSRGFGPLLPDTEGVPFGDAEALAQKLATMRFAAFLVEPVQAESGVMVPDPAYLKAARSLCTRYGTVLAFDEVQTGMYRSGPFLAAHHFDVEPDMAVMAKALSGGLIPSGAVLMSDEICDAVYSSLQRAVIHTSTYSENSLAMRAGLATLEVLENERLGDKAAAMGEQLRRNLTERLSKYEMVAEVRGLGLLSGVEFKAPRSLRLRLAFEAFNRIHPAMFGQVVVRRLFRDHGILSQICGNNFLVLKIAPPLVVSGPQLEQFAAALEQVVELMHASAGFWSEALGIARRVLGAI
jgi:ornithine--oxo-acid transaminase